MKSGKGKRLIYPVRACPVPPWDLSSDRQRRMDPNLLIALALRLLRRPLSHNPSMSMFHAPRQGRADLPNRASGVPNDRRWSPVSAEIAYMTSNSRYLMATKRQTDNGPD